MERKNIEQLRCLYKLTEKHIKNVRSHKEQHSKLKNRMGVENVQIGTMKRMFFSVIIEVSDARSRERSVFFYEIVKELCL